MTVPVHKRMSEAYTLLKGLIHSTVEKPPVVKVDLPDHPLLDGQVYVTVFGIDGKYRIDEIIRKYNEDRIGESWRIMFPEVVAHTVVLCLCDEDGVKIHTDNDLPLYLDPTHDARFSEIVWRTAFELNGMFDRSVRELVKNSERTPASGESSGSADSGNAVSGKDCGDSDTASLAGPTDGPVSTDDVQAYEEPPLLDTQSL